MSTVSLASSAADSDALEAIRSQHAELSGGLTMRTAALLAAVRRGQGWQGARDALVTWCRAELLPHTAAEETVLFPAARAQLALEPLISAMSYEHALLGDLVARLSLADDGPVALVHAGAAQTLFEAHVAEQNELLLPAMGEVTGAAYEQPVAVSHGHTCGCHDEASVAPELDARAIPHAIRHAAIFGALGAVAPAAELILVAPHDPLPLLHQIEQRWPSVFTIDYLERGPEAWRLRFTRAAAESVA